MMAEYSIEWYKTLKEENPKWLGIQALRLLEHYEKLEALLDSAYPFVAGHNWKDCDCIRCDWIRAYNHLIGSVDEVRPSPHIDNKFRRIRPDIGG